jgi:hypothetical protein
VAQLFGGAVSGGGLGGALLSVPQPGDRLGEGDKAGQQLQRRWCRLG